MHEFDINKDPFKIIFLSRFVERKGCIEAIQTIEMLVEEFPDIKLYMVGDGEMHSELEDYVVNHNLVKNIEFTGYLSGDKKYYLFYL